MSDIEVPKFFNSANGGNRDFSPSLPVVLQCANEYLKTYNFPKADADKTRIELLLLDW